MDFLRGACLFNAISMEILGIRTTNMLDYGRVKLLFSYILVNCIKGNKL